MNNRTNDPWELEMSRTFDQRVRDLHEAPLSFDQIQHKAGRIRRNRRAAVAGGVLAAAAVIVPVAVVGGGDLFDSSSKPPVADRDGENQREHAEDTGTFAYVEGRTLHLADGDTVRLGADYTWVAEASSGWFALRNDPDTGDLTLDLLDAGGEVTESADLASSPVVSDDRSTIAYATTDDTLVVREDGALSELGGALPENTFPVAVTDGKVYLQDGMGGPPQVVDLETGRTRTAVPDAIGLQDVTEGGLAAVMTESQDEGSCGGVHDLTTSDYLWQTCDYFLLGLSPDGRYVQATHPYLDGIGIAWTAILDARTGQELFRLESPGNGFYGTSAWQDDEHLLVTFFEYDSQEWSVHRISAAGTDDVVLGPKPGGDMDPVFRPLNAR